MMLLHTNFSDDCSGDIDIGEDLTCNIDNRVFQGAVGGR